MIFVKNYKAATQELRRLKKMDFALKRASLKEVVCATPFPAISKAVPWSGEVRTLVKPAV